MLVAASVITTVVLGPERMVASAVVLAGKKIAADLTRSDSSTRDHCLDVG